MNNPMEYFYTLKGMLSLWQLVVPGLIILIFMVVLLILQIANYKKTDYFKATHKNFFEMKLNTGNYGEYLTYKEISKYKKEGAEFLFNCYIPKDYIKTTEVDLIMIHSTGIYVFESKNYSGWIFGSEGQKNWVQSLPNGNKSEKNHFFNPIMQNEGHIKWLKKELGRTDIPYYSLIVFSERCTLKNIEVNSENVFVFNRSKVNKVVREIMNRQDTQKLTQEEVKLLYEKLYPRTQVSEKVKEAHISNIQKELEQEEKESHIGNIQKKVEREEKEITDGDDIVFDADLVCPRCGGKMVLRKAKRGASAGNQFYGCSNFPKCKYIKNI